MFFFFVWFSFCFSLPLFFSCHVCVRIENIGRFMSQTRGSHRSLRQSHLKGETEQRSTELDVFCVRHAMTKVTSMSQCRNQLSSRAKTAFSGRIYFFLDFSAPVTLKKVFPQKVALACWENFTFFAEESLRPMAQQSREM